jgi:hypothetical protein
MKLMKPGAGTALIKEWLFKNEDYVVKAKN